ncbi:MAG: Uma2 family endonuclease, partial [Okeania sp. SIO2H7]|nr:Uma2 family endonuclease [Okeania sp. SIO2H7]
QLLGYRLKDGVYEEIEDSRSEPLNLELKVEGKLIRFYREDTGEKLLYPRELADRWQQVKKERELAEKEYEQAKQERKLAEKKAKELEEKLARYRDRFGDLPEN